MMVDKFGAAQTNVSDKDHIYLEYNIKFLNTVFHFIQREDGVLKTNL